jgi:hypothetical protein
MSNGFKIDAELFDMEKFVAWFLWRCDRYEIRSRWTKAVAEQLVKEYNIDINAYEFDENTFKEFRG